MCYSAEVSLGTFLFVTAICGYLWYRNRKVDRAVALILFVIGFMQFLEYILWTNQECNDINKFITKIIPLYLFLQPVVITLIVWQMKAGHGTLYLPLLMGYSLFLPYILTQITPTKPCIHKGNCEHLNWNLKLSLRDDTPIMRKLSILFYQLLMFYSALTLNNKYLGMFFALSWASSNIITELMYKEVWASVWCHVVNANAIVALVI